MTRLETIIEKLVDVATHFGGCHFRPKDGCDFCPDASASEPFLQQAAREIDALDPARQVRSIEAVREIAAKKMEAIERNNVAQSIRDANPDSITSQVVEALAPLCLTSDESETVRQLREANKSLDIDNRRLQKRLAVFVDANAVHIENANRAEKERYADSFRKGEWVSIEAIADAVLARQGQGALCGPSAEDVLTEVLRCHKNGDDIIASFSKWWNQFGIRPVSEKDVTIAKLKERVHEQTLQTQQTYEQVQQAVLGKLRDHDCIPDGIDELGHPIEQVVGTCLAVLDCKMAEKDAEIARLSGVYKSMSEQQAASDLEIAKLQKQLDNSGRAVEAMNENYASKTAEVQQLKTELAAKPTGQAWTLEEIREITIVSCGITGHEAGCIRSGFMESSVLSRATEAIADAVLARQEQGAAISDGALVFLKRTTGEYRIVSSGDLTTLQIAEAQACHRFYVEPGGGFGWALLPWELRTEKDAIREVKIMPRTAKELDGLRLILERLRIIVGCSTNDELEKQIEKRREQGAVCGPSMEDIDDAHVLGFGMKDSEARKGWLAWLRQNIRPVSEVTAEKDAQIVELHRFIATIGPAWTREEIREVAATTLRKHDSPASADIARRGDSWVVEDLADAILARQVVCGPSAEDVFLAEELGCAGMPGQCTCESQNDWPQSWQRKTMSDIPKPPTGYGSWVEYVMAVVENRCVENFISEDILALAVDYARAELAEANATIARYEAESNDCLILPLSIKLT